MPTYQFTFDSLRKQYQKAIFSGYRFITCEQYYHAKKTKALQNRVVVNRIDIDISVKKAERIVEILNELEIKASFFIRLHAPEYNPFSFENYRIIKKIIESGHELGYHSEIIDQSVIWNEVAQDCLTRDIDHRLSR